MSTIRIAGKCKPEPDVLETTFEYGFEYTELYLEREHLDKLDKTIQACREADITVSSVHTPHVDSKAFKYVSKTLELAEKLDARMVVDSNPTPLTELTSFEESGRLDFSIPHGYENSSRYSVRKMKTEVLDKGLPMTLDTAHVYRQHPNNFRSDFKTYLEYDSQINIVHLCDATVGQDHLQLEEGDMPLEWIMNKYVESDEIDYIVLELAPGEEQQEALNRVQKYI